MDECDCMPDNEHDLTKDFESEEFVRKTNKEYKVCQCTLAASRRVPRHTGFFNTIAERLYEKCAGYNLRHCPYRGFVNNKNHLRNTVKDLGLLFCFLLANFVVFMTIVTRMAVQTALLFVETVTWIRRTMEVKSASQFSVKQSSPQSQFFHPNARPNLR